MTVSVLIWAHLPRCELVTVLEVLWTWRLLRRAIISILLVDLGGWVFAHLVLIITLSIVCRHQLLIIDSGTTIVHIVVSGVIICLFIVIILPVLEQAMDGGHLAQRLIRADCLRGERCVHCILSIKSCRLVIETVHRVLLMHLLLLMTKVSRMMWLFSAHIGTLTSTTTLLLILLLLLHHQLMLLNHLHVSLLAIQIVHHLYEWIYWTDLLFEFESTYIKYNLAQIYFS